MGGKGSKHQPSRDEKYDPSSKGPIKKRGCTDVPCCILFIIFLLAMVAVGLFAFIRGKPDLLLHPTDSQGNQCGVGVLNDRPVLFFFDLTKCVTDLSASVSMGCPTPQVCVSHCPNETWAWQGSGLDSHSRGKMICKHYPNGLQVDPNIEPYKSLSIKELVEKDYCAPYFVKSEEVLGRCVPAKGMLAISGRLVTADKQNVTDRYSRPVSMSEIQQGSVSLEVFSTLAGFGVRIYQDILATWWIMLIFLGAAMLLSLLWIILMQCLATPLVIISIIIFIGLFAFGTYYFLKLYFDMKDNPDHQGDFILTLNISYYWNLANTWLALGIIAAVILVIMILVLIFLRQRIRISVALISEASRAVRKMMSTLLWPVFPFVLHLLTIAFWGAAALYLQSVGQLKGMTVNQTSPTDIIADIPCDPTANDTAGKICDFIRFGGDRYIIYLQVFLLFMFFWLMHFIVAISQCTLAGAFASYFWAFDKKKDIPTFPLAASMSRCFRYHLGSLAFGSLVIAIVHLIRVILEYIEYKLKTAENQAAKFIVKCLRCCFWCFEKLLKMLTRNAYIMIAVYGKNFCSSAKRAFTLITSNVIRAFVVDKVTDFLLFIGKLMVVGAVGVPSFYMFSRKIPIESLQDFIDKYLPRVNYYIVPVLIVCIGSYMIASSFLGVYSMAVDTLFLCFLEDEERHDGTPEKPYYMSSTLKKILGKKNKPLAEDTTQM